VFLLGKHAVDQCDGFVPPTTGASKTYRPAILSRFARLHQYPNETRSGILRESLSFMIAVESAARNDITGSAKGRKGADSTTDVTEPLTSSNSSPFSCREGVTAAPDFGVLDATGDHEVPAGPTATTIIISDHGAHVLGED